MLQSMMVSQIVGQDRATELKQQIIIIICEL